MRVIAGSARSLPLKTPTGMDTRPTTDRTKETLFNILQPYIGGSVFMDLFSGSGAVGIEALSRGASKCYFFDKEKLQVECIKENLYFTKLQDNAIIIKQDVFFALPQIQEEEVTIVFMDPPYDLGYEKKALEQLKDRTYISNDTIIVIEASLRTDFSYLVGLGFEITKEKKYKTNQHVFLRRR